MVEFISYYTSIFKNNFFYLKYDEPKIITKVIYILNTLGSNYIFCWTIYSYITNFNQTFRSTCNLPSLIGLKCM